jgi:hypothetical protein
MYYLNTRDGFYGKKQGYTTCNISDVRKATPFKTFEEADKKGHDIQKRSNEAGRDNWYCVLSTCSRIGD